MQKREEFKEIEFGGRKWRISKFTAKTGSYIAYQILTHIIPMGIEGKLGNIPLPSGRATMSKEEFFDLQQECLMVCSEIQIVGSTPTPIPVMLPGGTWGVEGLENDAITALTLTIHALIFNVVSFFDENVLKEIGNTFKGLSFFNAST